MEGYWERGDKLCAKVARILHAKWLRCSEGCVDFPAFWPAARTCLLFISLRWNRLPNQHPLEQTFFLSFFSLDVFDCAHYSTPLDFVCIQPTTLLPSSCIPGQAQDMCGSTSHSASPPLRLCYGYVL